MATDTTPVIDVARLRKDFGSGKHIVHALRDLNLQVLPGQIAGFLGPNGAGKTTTIRVLLGMLSKDGGTARLFGGDPWSDRVDLHRRLAYVPGEVSLWPSMTGRQAMDALDGLRGAPVASAPGVPDSLSRDSLIERFELDPGKRIRTYSKGNKQKIALVAALSANVELLVLDEPTSGLDPLMEATFRECVAEATAAGRTVLLSSHILAEVEKLCDTVTIVRDGKTVEQGTLEQIRGIMRTQVRATVTRDPAALAAVPGIADLSIDEGAGRHSQAGQWDVVFTAAPEHVDAAMRAVGDLGVTSIVAAPPSLEDLFLRHYTDATVATPDQARAAASEGGAR